MRVLYCLVDGRTDYTPITGEQEAKLTQLIRDKAIPPSFALAGKTIVSDTIVGFTDKPVQPKQPSYKNYQEFRADVLGSEWYQRSKNRKQELAARQASP